MDKKSIHPLLYSAIVPLEILAQYYLIQWNTSKWIYFTIPFTFTFLFPLFFDCQPLLLYGCIAGHNMFNFMRMMDIALLPRSLVHKWSLTQYLDYFYTFSTAQMRKDLQVQGKRVGSRNAIDYKDRTTVYYRDLVWRLSLQYLVYHLLEWYSVSYPPDKEPVPLQLTHYLDFNRHLNNIVFGLKLCLTISINSNIFFHLVCGWFNAPLEPPMNAPFYARSFRDFWSNRWNGIIQQNLYRIGYIPTMAVLGHWDPQKKVGALHSLMGAFVTFLLSGIIHEWMIFVVMKEPSYGENMLFFVLHGLITMVEVMVSKFFLNAFGFDPILRLPHWIASIITGSIFLMTTPLFINPWVREDVFSKIRLPTVMDLLDPYRFLGFPATASESY